MTDTTLNTPLKQDLPSYPLGTESEPCIRKVGGFRGGYGEIIHRAVRILLPFILFVFLAVSLGNNNTSTAKSLPEVNCSLDISTIDISFIRRATNTFEGIYVAVSLFAVFYEGVMFTLRILNASMLEEKWKIFYFLDSVMISLFTHLFAGGIVGIYLMTWFWGPYISAVQADETNLGPAYIVYGMSWALYGFFISSYINYFIGYSIVVSRGVRRYCGKTGCGRCDNCKRSNPQ